MKKENPWKIINSKPIYTNSWIDLVEHDVINPNGGKGIYGTVNFKNYAVGIIPLDEHNNTWLVGQYRFATDNYSWEIPMGGGALADNPVESAQRELKEETGLSAADWQLIMRLHTSNSVCDEVGLVYIATQLSLGDTAFDETEDLAIKKLPLQEAVAMAMDGRITDAISIAGLLKVSRLKRG